ncbi:hypothetical protein G9G63_26130 [Paenibacillus sp. EKM202P]|uniref:hypothetical protein n=1 Tax=unclassified Paenibacillus TaxID=185978 RepID=UPI0013EC2969|nr:MULTISPECIES: hypothetical protein [unclassified Paenibacillus]KAF6558124.1 hypothetical protein G9G63_26130 [Paenibacillus sp. EKM202P]KAF6563210.1 hypothetical protein G9G64_26015 [Paenibacillus sp. EKM207P]MCP3777056.1 hypothetical protein [Paenibacillus sp. MZ03-122A]
MGLKMMFGEADSYKNSIYRETVTTYKFISELMIAMAKYNKIVDVLKTTSGDLFGYDLILNCENAVKLVQLKTTVNTSKWVIKNKLLKNINGEVIVIYLSFFDENDWNFRYRILDKSKVVGVNILPDNGETIINETLLEPERDIDHLAVYLFRELDFT